MKPGLTQQRRPSGDEVIVFMHRVSEQDKPHRIGQWSFIFIKAAVGLPVSVCEGIPLVPA